MLRVVGVASCRCCELSVLRVVVMRVVSVASCLLRVVVMRVVVMRVVVLPFGIMLISEL